MTNTFLRLSPARREKLLNACTREFARKGYELASTNTIVRACRISKGIFFKHFGTKESVYLSLARRCLTELGESATGLPRAHCSMSTAPRLVRGAGSSGRWVNMHVDPAKYAAVSPDLRRRFLSFLEAAEPRTVHAGELDWKYLDLGPREGRPLVFFTGGIKDPVFSFSVIEALDRACRVLAPTQPRCRTLDEYFAGLDAILDREGFQTFSVAGSSWGGQIAQAALVRYGGRVQKVILANTGGPSGGALLSMAVRIHRWSARRSDPASVVGSFKDRALRMLDDGGEAGVFWRAVFDDLYAGTIAHEDYLTLLDTQIDYLEQQVPKIRKHRFAGPLLVLTSRNETAGTAGMRKALLRSYPQARVHEFAQGGHHPALLNLEVYRDVVEGFLLEP